MSLNNYVKEVGKFGEVGSGFCRMDSFGLACGCTGDDFSKSDVDIL